MFQHIVLYGREVGKLRKLDAAAEALADKLLLPEDALLGAARLTVIGSKSALVENHRGILEYGTERIRIGTKHGQLTVSGTQMQLKAMNKQELLICGRILNVEWE